MKILSVKEQPDCFDGSLMKEVVFDQPVTKSFIDFMGEKGDLSYFPSFARPFFKVDVKGYYFLKGIEDNRTASLVLYKRNPSESLNQFAALVEAFSQIQG